MAGKKSKSKFEEFGGEMVVAPLTGFEFKESFSPSESLDGMQERMEERLKKVPKEQHPVYWERLKYELDIIIMKGFDAYF